MNAARDAALIAAAEVVRTEVKLRLRGGYTSGQFVTGNVWNSVKLSAPTDDPEGRGVRVYTDVTYALYWEVGHLNTFTRKATLRAAESLIDFSTRMCSRLISGRRCAPMGSTRSTIFGIG